jgi:RNA polymerase sigma factor (sigma-70 family)
MHVAMADARDAEDLRLLENGNHAQLLANYFHPVRQRCVLRLRDPDAADEATQRVFERLLGELRRGKRYSVPFRVVVWKVTEWTLNGFFPGAKQDGTLPVDWDPGGPDEGYAGWEERHDLLRLFEGLPPRQRQVLTLRFLEGLKPAEIAERLGIERNAVDQALHNGLGKLRERVLA